MVAAQRALAGSGIVCRRAEQDLEEPWCCSQSFCGGPVTTALGRVNRTVSIVRRPASCQSWATARLERGLAPGLLDEGCSRLPCPALVERMEVQVKTLIAFWPHLKPLDARVQEILREIRLIPAHPGRRPRQQCMRCVTASSFAAVAQTHAKRLRGTLFQRPRWVCEPTPGRMPLTASGRARRRASYGV